MNFMINKIHRYSRSLLLALTLCRRAKTEYPSPQGSRALGGCIVNTVDLWMRKSKFSDS
jgi:hypothetical protein